MTRRASPLALASLLLVAALRPAPAGAADPLTAPDSLGWQRWRLSNGLRVVAQHIPNCPGAAITVVYGGGSEDDPVGREGQAMLLAETAFLAPAGEIPERSRDEMESLRPLGYEVKVARRYVAFSENASYAQFPGVLHQVATRMRGVTVTPSLLRGAVESVALQQRIAFLSDPAAALYLVAREMAAGADSDALQRRSSGSGLRSAAAREIQQRIARICIPSNAVLSLVGNLSGYDVQGLTEREFGTIPAGVPPPASAPHPLRPGPWMMQRPGIPGAIGVLGVIAPAMSDTLHPSFYLALLLLGTQLGQSWGPPAPPLTTRFQYKILDDPDLARIYPPVPPSSSSPQDLSRALDRLGDVFHRLVTTPETMEALRRGVLWLLGGPLTPELFRRAQADATLLPTLATNAAVRELWGGEAYWSQYRRRFLRDDDPAIDVWFDRLAAHQQQVPLLFVPAR